MSNQGSAQTGICTPRRRILIRPLCGVLALLVPLVIPALLLLGSCTGDTPASTQTPTRSDTPVPTRDAMLGSWQEIDTSESCEMMIASDFPDQYQVTYARAEAYMHDVDQTLFAYPEADELVLWTQNPGSQDVLFRVSYDPATDRLTVVDRQSDEQTTYTLERIED